MVFFMNRVRFANDGRTDGRKDGGDHDDVSV